MDFIKAKNSKKYKIYKVTFIVKSRNRNGEVIEKEKTEYWKKETIDWHLKGNGEKVVSVDYDDFKWAEAVGYISL